MWFAKTQIETSTIPAETPAQRLGQLEQLRHARREAKAEFDNAWKFLQQFLHAHPPLRRPFLLNDRFFVPVNFVKNVPTEQRELENRVFRSKSRWNALQKQESDLEFALRLKR